MNAVEKIEPQGPVSVIPVVSETAAFLSMIERAARDPVVDMEKMKGLMDMARTVRQEHAEEEFNQAMATVQSKMRSVATDANNPQTRSKYASYFALDKAIRPIYSAEGLALSFDTEECQKPEHIRVVCYVTRGRHTRKYKIDMPADGKGAKGGDVMTKTHAAGSAFSYGQRYLLKMIFNIAVGGDDDGNAAGASAVSQAPPPPGSISQDQADQIRDLLDSLNVKPAAFLAWAKQKRIVDIPEEHFESCITEIKRVGKAPR